MQIDGEREREREREGKRERMREREREKEVDKERERKREREREILIPSLLKYLHVLSICSSRRYVRSLIILLLFFLVFRFSCSCKKLLFLRY